MHPLDNPGWHALNGPHSGFAEWSANGAAARYDGEVSPFAAVGDDVDETAWAGMAEFAAGGGVAVMARAEQVDIPDGWRALFAEGVTQYVAGDLAAVPEVASSLVRLRADDSADMMELTALTEPGPFLARTHEMGRYLGWRSPNEGRLLAMAGERLSLDGWTEVSAVCTHPDAQRQGWGAALTLAVAHGVRERGNEAFLHVRADNAPAHSLYRAIGFEERCTLWIGAYGLLG